MADLLQLFPQCVASDHCTLQTALCRWVSLSGKCREEECLKCSLVSCHFQLITCPASVEPGTWQSHISHTASLSPSLWSGYTSVPLQHSFDIVVLSGSLVLIKTDMSFEICVPPWAGLKGHSGDFWSRIHEDEWIARQQIWKGTAEIEAAQAKISGLYMRNTVAYISLNATGWCFIMYFSLKPGLTQRKSKAVQLSSKISNLTSSTNCYSRLDDSFPTTPYRQAAKPKYFSNMRRLSFLCHCPPFSDHRHFCKNLHVESQAWAIFFLNFGKIPPEPQKTLSRAEVSSSWPLNWTRCVKSMEFPLYETS